MGKTHVLVLFVLSIFSFLNSQDLKGEWVLIQVANTFGLSNNITRITNDSIYFYSFDEVKNKLPISFIDPYRIIVDGNVIEFGFIDNHVMMVKSVNKEPENELKYVRLLPTLTGLNQISNLKGSTLALELKNETISVRLNSKLDINEAIISDSALIAADSVSIEKRMDTLFLNFYTAGILSSMFPIKEISENGLALYGIPSHDGLVHAKKIE